MFSVETRRQIHDDLDKLLDQSTQPQLLYVLQGKGADLYFVFDQTARFVMDGVASGLSLAAAKAASSGTSEEEFLKSLEQKG